MAAQRLGAQRSPPALSTETPRLPQEAPDALLPLLHGEASQIRQASPRNEQPGSHQDPVQEIQGASREEKGTGWGWGGGRLLVPLQLSQHNRHGSAPAWLRCHPALLQPRWTCWPCAASQGCGVGVEVEVTSVRPSAPSRQRWAVALPWGGPCWDRRRALAVPAGRAGVGTGASGRFVASSKRAGVQSPPCRSPTAGASPGLPAGRGRRWGWLPASRLGKARLGAAPGLQPYRGSGASPACGVGAARSPR